MTKRAFIFIGIALLLITNLNAACHGKFINPISDICWKCIFPIRVAGIEVVRSHTNGDEKNTKRVICKCFRPQLRMTLPGIPISFWEPVRLIDITREPYCMVSLGGKSLSKSGEANVKGRGDPHAKKNVPGHKESFYQAHWYIYPIIYWLEVIMDFMCLDNASIDVSYMTELDPLWNDDKKAFILHPEAILFGSLIAQGACIADCAAASRKKGLPLDPLFWCNGCQGSLYPFTGMVPLHSSGVQGSLLITGKLMAKLHRELLLWGTTGSPALCQKYPMPFIRKSQYRLQMTYPLPDTQRCHAFGETETLWYAGKEFPVKGEDFAYLIWRKRDCCLI
ncbi:MAG: TraU family protein [Candidatus Paracaedibacteraceae bacterium]|nr:TraU family protein [Candidatus Paracaedibacteraceae bacterium]